MDIQPLSITVQGFRSFLREEEFKFIATSGLCAMQGVNESSPEMGANAVGKSSLWEALFYCLYGKSTMGLSSKDLQNWDKDVPLKVRFHFLANGKPAFIVRTPKPVMTTVLMSEGIERQVSQTELDAWLGMSGEVFIQAVLAGQFTNLFLDLAPIDKLKFVSALVDLTRWERYKDLTDRRHATILTDKTEAELQIRGIEGQLAQSSKTADLYQEKSATWELERENRVNGLNAELKRVYLRHETLTNTLTLFEKAHIAENEDALKGALNKNIQENQQLRAKSDEYTLEIARGTGNLTSHRTNIRRLEGLISKGYLCPTCGQKASPGHVKTELEGMQVLVEELTSSLQAIATKKEKLLDKLRQLETQKANLDLRMSSITQEERKYQSKVHTMELEIAGVSNEIEHLKATIKTARTDVNQYVELYRKQIEEVKKYNSSLREAQAKLKMLAYQEGMHTFWKKGFREIQLFLLSEVVNQLELSYNSALASLGMPDWKISIQVENENKSGGVSNKFHVLIYSPTHDDPIPWESFCGGEKQRLRLACAFGTFDLVSQLTGVFWKLEVWDEPAQHLSEAGEENLIQYLRQRAQILNKQIWVIDHRSMKNADYDHITTVRKDSSGSHFQ